MNTTVVFATSLALSAIALSTSAVAAQGARGSLATQRERDRLPCALTPAVADSARAEAMSVLFSDTPVLTELRHEQGIPLSPSQVDVSVVADGSVCQRLASNFGHPVSPSTRVTVLRLGPIFYARDPDQHHATGFFADSTLRVLVRLGPPMDK